MTLVQDRAGSVFDCRRALLAGPLGRAGGVAVFANLPDAATVDALRNEALALFEQADRQEHQGPDPEDWRGGLPPRALCTAGAGPVQDALYSQSWLAASLTEQCGVPIVPSGNRGSYSYYVAPGDYLGLHLDVVTCDVTLITVLQETTPMGAGGALAVYRHHAGAPLRDVRAAPDVGVELVKAAPGQSIVLLGGLVPHCTVPLGPSGQRVISALCFQVAETARAAPHSFV